MLLARRCARGENLTNLNQSSTLPDDLKREMTETFGMVPSFMFTVPPAQTRLWWQSMRDFELSEKTALDNKTKQLIGLGVASQIPCQYCIVFHTESARMNGATEQELQEAIFMAGMTRLGSTILNGSQLDEETFNSELREIVSFVKQKGPQGAGKEKQALRR